MVDKTMKETR